MDIKDTSIKTNTSKITEALELLNEAAREKRLETKELLTDRYSHIKQAIMDGATQGMKVLDNAKHIAWDAIADGGEKVKKAAKEVDKKVHDNPWPYIGGVAVVSLLLGYLMGSKRK